MLRFPVHPMLETALQKNVQRKGYLPVQGLSELRHAIASYYSRTLNSTFEAQQVIVAPGSKAGVDFRHWAVGVGDAHPIQSAH